MAFNVMFITSFYILILSFLACGSKCSKIVQFEVPVTIQPLREIYSVGDTIWIEARISNIMTDHITGEMINIGLPDLELGMSVYQLLDSSWVYGISNISHFEITGEVNKVGVTFPTFASSLFEDPSGTFQSWKFGVILENPKVNLVFLFQKREPSNWSGEYKFPEKDNCIFGINSSTFLTNNASQDYAYYVSKFPYFRESGLKGDQAENHRKAGAFFLKVE